MVTRDGAVPVTSHPGNRPDVTQSSDAIDELLTRHRHLAGADAPALSVVFDGGQNSAANFAHLTETGLGFVGSLPPSEHPDLLAVPARRRRAVDGADR